MDGVEVAIGILSTVIAGQAAAWLTWLRSFRKEQKERDQALEAGVRSLLRGEVIRAHHAAMRNGSMSTTEREVMTRNYEAYKCLGGNGVAVRLYDEAMGLPTSDD